MLKMNFKASRTKSQSQVEKLLQTESNSDLNQDGNSGGCEKSLLKECLLRIIKLTGYADVLDVGNKRKRN